jgi:multisubunit Na+/H+ antiporter MnhE subunit
MKILGLPCLLTGSIHALECIAAMIYSFTRDLAFVDAVCSISAVRTLVGSVGYFILFGTALLSFGISVVYIGRDDRQVIKKKDKLE